MVLVVKNLPANAGGHKRCMFDSWVGKIPWRMAWQPTPVSLPGESHGQRSLVGYSPWGHEESDVSEYAHTGGGEEQGGARVCLQRLGGSARAGAARQSGQTVGPPPVSVPGCGEGGRYVGLGRTLQGRTAGGCPVPWCAAAGSWHSQDPVLNTGDMQADC